MRGTIEETIALNMASTILYPSYILGYERV